MRLGRGHNRATGFTLIELIVSVGLMCVILGTGYACLRAGMLTRKTVELRADMIQRARVALNLMSADLRSACPLSKEFEFLGMHRTIEEESADNLDFATHQYTPRGKQEGDFCEVSYFLDRDESGNLRLWRRRDASPDAEPLAGGMREEIVSGIRSLRLEYYDGLSWFDEWGDPEGRRKKQRQPSLIEESNLSGMPEAVRITLVMAAASAPKRNGEKKEKKEKEKDEEPPLTFQTVARLNLTPISTWGESSGGGGGSGGSSGETKDAENVPQQ